MRKSVGGPSDPLDTMRAVGQTTKRFSRPVAWSLYSHWSIRHLPCVFAMGVNKKEFRPFIRRLEDASVQYLDLVIFRFLNVLDWPVVTPVRLSHRIQRVGALIASPP